jgi:uncharacterized protein YxeA
MKKILLIFALIAFVILMILFVGQSRFFLHSNIVNSPSDVVKQQEEMQPSQNEDEQISPSDAPSDNSQNENESEKDIKTDTGTYQGQIDNNFIEITISGVPEENATRVFMLSDEVKDEFLDMQLSIGEVIKFRYFLNEDEQNVIVGIETLNGARDDK